MDMKTVTEAFDLIDSWEERFEIVADLGRQLTPIAESERIDANRVPGCETKTWLTGSLRPGATPSAPDTIEFRADAETPLVRGLVALLLMPFQGHTPREVLETDPNAIFAPLHLEEALQRETAGGHGGLHRPGAAHRQAARRLRGQEAEAGESPRDLWSAIGERTTARPPCLDPAGRDQPSPAGPKARSPIHARTVSPV